MMEIVKGCQQAQATARTQRFLNAVAKEDVLPLGATAAELAGRIAGDLERTGQTIGMADPIIAAIALEHNLELVDGLRGNPDSEPRKLRNTRKGRNLIRTCRSVPPPPLRPTDHDELIFVYFVCFVVSPSDRISRSPCDR